MSFFIYTSELNNRKFNYRLRLITVKELYTIIQRSDLITEILTERDVHLIFNQSLNTYIDELNEDRHMKMSYKEFIEALARIAEKLSPAPIGE